MPKHGHAKKKKKKVSKKKPRRAVGKKCRPDPAAAASDAAGVSAPLPSVSSPPPPPPPPPPASVAGADKVSHAVSGAADGVPRGAPFGASSAVGVGAGVGAGTGQPPHASSVPPPPLPHNHLPFSSTTSAIASATMMAGPDAGVSASGSGTASDDDGDEADAPVGPVLLRRDSLVANKTPVPEGVVINTLAFLDAESTAACRAVSRRWRTLASSPYLWRLLCKHALGLHAPAAAAALKPSLRDCPSWMVAFQRIPQVLCNGLYSYQTSYVRKSYINDMFHPIDGELRVRYHRSFMFRPDGTMLYAMTPGPVEDNVRLFTRRSHKDIHVGSYELQGHELHARFETVVGNAKCSHLWVFDFTTLPSGVVSRRSLRCARQQVQGLPTNGGVNGKAFRFYPIAGV